MGLVNRYRLESVLRVGQCTLQYRIMLFNSLLKIFPAYIDIVLSEYV